MCITFLKYAIRCLVIIPFSIASITFAQEKTTIDVLVAYTPGVAAEYAGDPSTRINQLFAVSNQIYKDSGVNLQLRLAKAVSVNYTDDNAAETALNDITKNSNAAFSTIPTLREQYKADMVILYRPYKDIQGSCGLAWIGGIGANGDFSNPQYKSYMFAHIAITVCGDYVTAHELGHNMGLNHSRKQDTTGGTFPYALGYGVDGLFTTIMAYTSVFNVDYWSGKEYKFSSPLLTCRGVPCGLNRTDANAGADAVYALNQTAPQIAKFYTAAVTTTGATTELDTLNQKVISTKAAYDQAVKALADNKTAIATKTTAQTLAQTALTKSTADAKTAKTKYEAALKTYKTTAATAASLAPKVSAALSKYNGSTSNQLKANNLKAYNTTNANYTTAVKKAADALAASEKVRAEAERATAALKAATDALNAAKQALTTEKSLTVTLTGAVATAKAANAAAVNAYNAAVKKGALKKP